MEIIVFAKQVPDTTEIKVDPEKGTLIRDGVPSIMNSEDKNALELALTFKDDFGAKVKVVTLGPPAAEEILREAYAMGADECYLVTDPLFAGADTWVTSLILSKVARMIGFDLILCGRQAIDGDTAQVGMEIAEHLGVPVVANAVEVSYSGEYFKVKRELDDVYEVILVKPPCLITCTRDLNVPRYMSLYGIFDAFKKEINVLSNDVLKFEKNEVGLIGSPTKVRRTFTKAPERQGKVLQGNLDEAVDEFLRIVKKVMT